MSRKRNCRGTELDLPDDSYTLKDQMIFHVYFELELCCTCLTLVPHCGFLVTKNHIASLENEVAVLTAALKEAAAKADEASAVAGSALSTADLASSRAEEAVVTADKAGKNLSAFAPSDLASYHPAGYAQT